jgi:hypothetical protein
LEVSFMQWMEIGARTDTRLAGTWEALEWRTAIASVLPNLTVPDACVSSVR